MGEHDNDKAAKLYEHQVPTGGHAEFHAHAPLTPGAIGRR